MKTFWIAFTIWNIFVFLLMGYDKLMAIKQRRRVSEKTLLLCAFLFGAIGEVLGGSVFHHKTRKRTFQICWPIALIVNLAVIAFITNGSMPDFTEL